MLLRGETRETLGPVPTRQQETLRRASLEGPEGLEGLEGPEGPEGLEGLPFVRALETVWRFVFSVSLSLSEFIFTLPSDPCPSLCALNLSPLRKGTAARKPEDY